MSNIRQQAIYFWDKKAKTFWCITFELSSRCKHIRYHVTPTGKIKAVARDRRFKVDVKILQKTEVVL